MNEALVLIYSLEVLRKKMGLVVIFNYEIFSISIMPNMNSGFTKRGFEIYNHLMSFDMEPWDQRK